MNVRHATCILAISAMFLAMVSTASAQRNSPNNRSRTSSSKNHKRGGNRTPSRPHSAARFPVQFRTIDGSANNIDNPDWGVADTEFLRLVTPDYADGAASPSGSTRPNPRAISDAVMAQSTSVVNTAGASDYLWQWGQFLDHDINETPLADPAEAFDILIPSGDIHFDPTGTGTQSMGLSRSSYNLVNGVREQVNLITSYIDASNVYGSDDARANALRTLDGTGKLLTSAGDLLPFNSAGLHNAPSSASTFFLAGDVRANEQIGLTAMHTLFLREHNHWADQLALILGPSANGEFIYQLARSIVAAEMQAITYREFLPLLLGRRALTRYRTYRPNTNASISNLFAAAAYRVGHTMLSPDIQMVDGNGAMTSMPLASAFFNPTEITSNGIDHILRGLNAQDAQQIDNLVVDDVRNFLFGPPGAGGFDLASLNIQRGRDHGLPDYNTIRVAMGRSAAVTFADITTDVTVATKLASVYATVDDIDPWVGLLSEDHDSGALVGETLKLILVDQFTRLRDGDRFWYEDYMPDGMVRFINQQTLSRIIKRNTAIGSELPSDVFMTQP